MNVKQTETSLFDVIIVGAGPVGLAIALGLKKRGINNIMVFDQTRTFRQVGQGIDLLPNGLKALKYIDINAYENIQTVGQKFNSLPNDEGKKNQHPLEWKTLNINGEIIRSVPLAYDEYFKKYGEGRVSISWYNLQTQLRNLLPPDLVQANHRCINVVEEPDLQTIRVDFVSNLEVENNPYSHWSETPIESPTETQNQSPSSPSRMTSIRGKLLIAADGINSTIRQIIYQNTPYCAYQTPEYTGFSAISSGGTNELPTTLAKEIYEKFLHNSRVVTMVNEPNSPNSLDQEIPRLIIFSPQPDQFTYLLHAALPLELLKNKSGKALIEMALEELQKAKFPDSIQQLVALSSPQQVVQRPYYIHSVDVATKQQIPWNLGRVILVGDAAHGMPPFMAQGANQGLEDAAVITSLITKINQEKAWDNMVEIAGYFKKYEQFRRPLLHLVQQATLSRLPLLSEKHWEEYCQQVYGRQLELPE